MTTFDAIYYDGRTSARDGVQVRAFGDSLHISGATVDFDVPIAGLSVDAPIAGARCAIHLPDGAQLQTDDHAALEALFPRANRLERWVYGREHRWPHALAALVIVVALGAWCATYGVPLAAEFAARLVSPEMEAMLGEQALSSVDAMLCAPSALDTQRQQTLQTRFAVLVAGLDDGHRYRLELRACREMGPNAFALPGGAIVLTDKLVELAQNDAQVSAVLAHEVGHVRYRHGLRQALQGAGLTALISALAGDAVSISSLATTLPTVLLESGYSRKFENEADSYAFQRLKDIGLSPENFVDILMRLESFHRGSRESGAGEHAIDYLSTHPATERRIERAKASE